MGNWNVAVERQQDQATIARLEAELVRVNTDHARLYSEWIATENLLHARIAAQDLALYGPRDRQLEQDAAATLQRTIDQT
jgi:hypothetical protein